MKDDGLKRSDEIRQRENRVSKCFNAVNDRVWSGMAAVGGLVLTLVPLIWPHTPKALFFLVGVVTLIGGFGSVWASDSTNKLMKENDDLRAEVRTGHKAIRETISNLVETTCRDNDSWNADCRATIYAHEDVLAEHQTGHKGKLVPVARVSSNPILCQLGRDHYPDDEGIIGAAWAQGFATGRFPPKDEANRVDSYTKPVNSWPESVKPLDRETAERLAMKSRRLVGIRIDSAHGIRIGLVMFESTSVKSFDSIDEHRLLNSKEIGVLSRLLDTHAPYLNHVTDT